MHVALPIRRKARLSNYRDGEQGINEYFGNDLSDNKGNNKNGYGNRSRHIAAHGKGPVHKRNHPDQHHQSETNDKKKNRHISRKVIP
jgi:hypothetical protein